MGNHSAWTVFGGRYGSLRVGGGLLYGFSWHIGTLNPIASITNVSFPNRSYMRLESLEHPFPPEHYNTANARNHNRNKLLHSPTTAYMYIAVINSVGKLGTGRYY
jgi:hypothetical protein